MLDYFTCLVLLFASYSFSLTWIKTSRGEGQLMYHLSSVGTFEKVTLDWMRETMMFSTSMCPVSVMKSGLTFKAQAEVLIVLEWASKQASLKRDENVEKVLAVY